MQWLLEGRQTWPTIQTASFNLYETGSLRINQTLKLTQMVLPSQVSAYCFVSVSQWTPTITVVCIYSLYWVSGMMPRECWYICVLLWIGLCLRVNWWTLTCKQGFWISTATAWHVIANIKSVLALQVSLIVHNSLSKKTSQILMNCTQPDTPLLSVSCILYFSNVILVHNEYAFMPGSQFVILFDQLNTVKKKDILCLNWKPLLFFVKINSLWIFNAFEKHQRSSKRQFGTGKKINWYQVIASRLDKNQTCTFSLTHTYETKLIHI